MIKRRPFTTASLWLSILVHPNHTPAGELLTRRHLDGDHTWYDNVYIVSPVHWLTEKRGKTLDLGLRIEIQPMDTHCHNISLGLYQKEINRIPHFLVHTYSSHPMATERIQFICRALREQVGLVDAPDLPGWLLFPCGSTHRRALRRSFLDLCKLETNAALQMPVLSAHDKKAECPLSLTPQGDGLYAIHAATVTDKSIRRVSALARGYAKLCDMDVGPSESNVTVSFPCKTDHHALLGLLMYRAQNIRATMQEQEVSKGRGVLSAPTNQD